MRKIGTYCCDAGSLVINGIGISNGIGDGDYDIYYFESESEALKHNYKNTSLDLWIDLRTTSIQLWTYDCDRDCHKIYLDSYILNADAVTIWKDEDGNFALVRYF